MAIIIPIGVDTSGLKKLNTAGGKLRAFGKIAAVAAGAAALGGLVKTLQVGTAEFMEQQKVAAQTGAVLKSTGSIANVTAEQMEKLSGALMKKSGVDDEAIQSGQNLLLTFTKIRNETGRGNDIFDQATVAMLDLSVAMGKDLNSSAILVGKALNDPVRGATALTRAGIQLTEQQKNQIERFVESGRVMEAQKIILQELTTQFGGSAEAAGKTLPGQLNILKQTFSNLAGELAGRFLPGVARAATALTEFLLKFAAAPTLKAKVELITGSISDVFARIRTWWTTGERKELPARVILTPPGREQVRQLFVQLERQSSAVSESAGRRIGRALARGILDGTSAGLDPSFFGLMKRLFLPYRFFQLGRDIASGILDGFRSEMEAQGASFIDVVKGIFRRIPGVELGIELGEKFRDGYERAVKKGPASLKNVITPAVREAIQDARRTLESGGAGIAGTLSTILGATFTRPGGMKPADILSEERAIEDQRLAMEEARLSALVASDEATDEDRLALREFYLNKEKILRDRALQEEIGNREKGIADLIESFNQGLISADKFSADLESLIGSDRGAELGDGFAAAFGRAIQELKNLAAGIFGVIGTGEKITAGGGGGVSSVLESENQRRYDEAKAAYDATRQRWQTELDELVDIPKDDRTKKQVERIAKLRANLKNQKKPTKKQYGVTELALGGILKQPTFVAGEAGKEAVIPLESSSAMDILRQAVGGGGGGNQVINLTVNAGLGTNPDELSRVIVDSIKYYERRNGQVFTGPLVQSVSSSRGSLAQALSSGPTDFNRITQRRRG